MHAEPPSEALQREQVLRRRGIANEYESRLRPESRQHRERSDEIVLTLVGGQSTHEQHRATIFGDLRFVLVELADTAAQLPEHRGDHHVARCPIPSTLGR